MPSISPDGEVQRLTVSDMLGVVDQESLWEASHRIYMSLQVVLEFMDKGYKGLLTGDLCPLLIVDIQKSIEKYLTKVEQTNARISELQEKEKVLDLFLSQHFKFDKIASDALFE
jgi:hypothetical protein